MTWNDYLMFRLLLGIIYWSVNIFIRKLHTINEPEDGWYLSMLWVLLPELCIFSLFVMYLVEKKNSILDRF